MEIIEVSAEEFKSIIPNPYHIFGSAPFVELNADKAEDVYYLLFKDSKYRLGLTGGVRGSSFYSPFSAPFGGFVFLNDDVRISILDEAITSLLEWAKDKQLISFHLTLPPPVYNESFISKQVNALYRKKFDISNIDLSYSFNLDNFSETYPSSIWRNARKNLKIAFENELLFVECKNNEEKKLAYDIIRKNREARGFPLHMSWEQVLKTTQLIPSGFFLVKDSQGRAIASAVIFHVAVKIVRVIYWGDLPGVTHLKTMNFLSYKVFEHFKAQGIQTVDIGISTENSVPNHGLCEFKESIGCDINTKFAFTKRI